MKYQAKFADGEIYKVTTSRKCSVALKVTQPDGKQIVTFSKNKVTALSLANDYTRIYSVPRLDMSKLAEESRRENAEFKAKCIIEVVGAYEVN